VRIQHAIDIGTAERVPVRSGFPEGQRVRYRFASTTRWSYGTVLCWLRLAGDVGPAIAWDGVRGAHGDWGWFGRNGDSLQAVKS